MKCDGARKNIASVLDDLFPNPAWIARPNLAMVSMQMRVLRIKHFLETNGKSPSSMHENVSTAMIANSKLRSIFLTNDSVIVGWALKVWHGNAICYEFFSDCFRSWLCRNNKQGGSLAISLFEATAACHMCLFFSDF